MLLRNRERDALPFTTKDGSTIREYLHTEVQSLAEASLGQGQATRRHYHARSEEIYLVVDGHGELEVDGETRPVAAVRGSPKPPPIRITLTLPAINSAEEIWLIAAGKDKAAAVAMAIQYRALVHRRRVEARTIVAKPTISIAKTP